jgi:5-methylcytosine-specific restriction protein A
MIKQEFEKILKNYETQKKTSFTQNTLAKIIRFDLPSKIYSDAHFSKNYLVAGSAGQGNWAAIPWICIFDREITESAQKGYYFVYLFQADLGGFYLSLNQGWTQFEKKYGVIDGREKIQQTAEKFKEILRTIPEGFSTEKISLKSNGTLAKGYELGHICGKFYEKDNIPEDNILLDDLRNMLGVYREVKKIVGPDIWRVSNVDSEILISPEDEVAAGRISDKIEDISNIEQQIKTLETTIGSSKPAEFTRLIKAIARSKKVVNLIKKRSRGVCKICGEEGFEKRDGDIYVEAHHIKELSKSMIDLPNNMMAVCPTCHRILHYGSEKALKNRIKKRA